MKKVPYRQAIGSLLYLAVATRPDISFAVAAVARYSNNPAPEHWTAVKKIFRYLQDTSSMGIIYPQTGRFEIEAYSDASWNRDKSHRSISGYVILANESPIVWVQILNNYRNWNIGS